MCMPAGLVKSKPFTVVESPGLFATGVLITVPGEFNVLLRVTSNIDVEDLTLGFGPMPLLAGALVDSGAAIECFLPFAQSQADHRFRVTATAPGPGAISFTFGRIDGLTC